MCIGDRYQIGGAVLEVTQPRVTCYRVGIRMGEPQMAALLVSHRRPGFYCRVITEGEVEAGQPIIKLASGPEQVSVAEIDALLYLPGHPREALERALRIPALSPGWKGSLQSLADQSETGSASAGNTGLTAAATSPPPAWTGFRPLRVTAVRDESLHVRSVSLADPDGAALPEWFAGQSITVRLYPQSGDGALVRNYSLSNDPNAGEFRISVKRESHGLASQYIHTHLAVGDTVDVAAPRGTFFLADGAGPVVLISAGVGVTPLLSMLHVLADAASAREVWWLHGARDGAEQPFAGEAAQLLNQLPANHSHIVFSRPASTDRLGEDYDAQGRLSRGCAARTGAAAGRRCLPVRSDFFHGGSSHRPHRDRPGSAHIHAETFGAGAALTPGIVAEQVPPHLPSGPAGTGPVVQFARSGISAPWGNSADSLLEFAEACDVPTRWSCRTGVCHNCETALLAGSVTYDPEPLEPPAEGNILICCSQPTEPVTLDL